MFRLRSRWQSAPVRRKALLIVALSVTPSLAASLGILWGELEQHELAKWTAASSRRLNDMRAVVTLVVDEETACRGYLLTNNEEFLEPFNRARAILPNVLAEIGSSVEEHQKQRFATILELIDTKQEIVAAHIDARKHKLSEGPNVPLLLEGKHTMDTIRVDMAALISDEEAALRIRTDRLRHMQRGIYFAMIAAMIASMVSAIVAGRFLLTRVVNRIVRLQTAAERISLDQPFQLVMDAPDEIGRLQRALWRAGRMLIQRHNAEKEARKAAEAASVAKSDFLSRMSHELRTPMNSILGFAQLLQQDELTEDQRDNLDHILGGGRHLLTLIDELLDISRIESGRMEFNLERVNATRVVNEVLASFRPLAGAADIETRVDSPIGDVEVQADRHRLRQILLNLVSNAIKYNRTGGSVVVALGETTGRQVRIDVRDTGRGISPDRIADLFTPFERLDAEATGIEGTGLGLAVSRAFARGMHGELQVSSNPDAGTTFSLLLPSTAGAET